MPTWFFSLGELNASILELSGRLNELVDHRPAGGSNISISLPAPRLSRKRSESSLADAKSYDPQQRHRAECRSPAVACRQEVQTNARRLSEDEIVTVRVLEEKGQNHCAIARTLGVTEGTVRYHLRRAAEGAEDGRKFKAFKVEPLAEVIAAWHDERAPGGVSTRRYVRIFGLG